jgi:hypothetical protein
MLMLMLIDADADADADVGAGAGDRRILFYIMIRMVQSRSYSCRNGRIILLLLFLVLSSSSSPSSLYPIVSHSPDKGFTHFGTC